MNDVKAKSGDGVIIRDSSAGSLLDSDSQIVDIVGTERNKKKRSEGSRLILQISLRDEVDAVICQGHSHHYHYIYLKIIPCHASSSQDGLVVL